MRRLALWLLCILLLALPVSAQVGDGTPRRLVESSTTLETQHPLALGLVSWWRVVPLLDGTPQWYDLAGMHHATLTNMATAGTSGWGSTYRMGGLGEIRCDGTNDFLDVGTPTRLTDVTQRSVVVWIKANSFGGASSSRIMDKRPSGGWAFFVNNVDCSNGLAFVQNFTSGAAQWCLASAITTGTWQQVAFTYDASSASNTVTFYVNGANKGAGAVVGSWSGTAVSDAASNLRLCDRGDATRAFDGTIDDVLFYNRLLTDAEVLALYRQSLQGYPSLLSLPAPEVATVLTNPGFSPAFFQ